MLSFQILLLLVLLCLSHLLIMLILRTMMLKLFQLVRRQTRENLSQEHPLTFFFKKKKKTRDPRTKKGNNQKSKQKKQHLCHHYGATGHIRPNCYKQLATQQSNSIISSRNQNQFPSSFASLGDLLKTLMFLSNLNSFNSSPSPPNQRFAKERFF